MAVVNVIEDSAVNPLPRAFTVGLAHLKAFVAAEGHADVPHDHICDDGYHLGMWVLNQRAFHLRGTLPPEEQAAIKAVPGWCWNRTMPKKRAVWTWDDVKPEKRVRPRKSNAIWSWNDVK